MTQSIGPGLRKNWQKLSVLPGGKWLFSRIIGFMAPYSGSIRATVDTLEPGYGCVLLKDRKRVRNHLNSVHAIALVNLAEMVTGLTLLNSLPDHTRAILTGIQMQYHIKARGKLRAECRCQIPQGNEEQTIPVVGEIKNEAGEVVATGTASWLVGPE